MTKTRFYVERNSFGVHAMVVLMVLSVVFRILGCWGLWQDRTYVLTQIALPIFSALLYAGCVWLLGRRALWVSFIPLTLGAVFFILKSLTFESKLHTILCILLYIAVIVLYFSTVFGMIRTKWILVLLFGLPFLYHIFVEDLTALRDTVNPVSFTAGMQEMGVLCIMLGLCVLSASMKKLTREAVPHNTRRLRKPWKKRSEEDEDASASQGPDEAAAPSAEYTQSPPSVGAQTEGELPTDASGPVTGAAQNALTHRRERESTGRSDGSAGPDGADDAEGSYGKPRQDG